MVRLRQCIFILLLPLVLVACGTKQSSFTIISSADLDTSIALDLVVVTGNPEIVDEIIAAGSAAWFAKKAVFQVTYPDSLKLASFQIPPAYIVSKAEWPEGVGKNQRFFIVAQSPNIQKIIAVEGGKLSSLTLDKTGITVTP
ncbi:hypothetical protein [Kordiimonas pumila]|uniref:Type VI secretion system lipoprotein TssJ n=1 Tax=Kordiimonas pumila TaxID=2161677 RepID=A0ABV7D3U4_9PROT|nr:hypothetical protein [Kordiimonas pumila]